MFDSKQDANNNNNRKRWAEWSVIKTEKYIEALKDISYYDWIRLREGVDREFNRKIDESKKNLKLTDSENIKKIIRSQFGGR